MLIQEREEIAVQVTLQGLQWKQPFNTASVFFTLGENNCLYPTVTFSPATNRNGWLLEGGDGISITDLPSAPSEVGISLEFVLDQVQHGSSSAIIETIAQHLLREGAELVVSAEPGGLAVDLQLHLPVLELGEGPVCWEQAAANELIGIVFERA